MKQTRILASLLLTALLAFGSLAYADTARDVQIQGALAQQFSQDKALRDVHAIVQNGAVTLQGSVPLYRDKLNAEKQARQTAHVSSVRDLVQVAGPGIPDAQLAHKLATGLEYELVGYGNAFNAVSGDVSHGVVTLNGFVRTPYDESRYLNLVERTPGVKDVVNHLQVAPVSNFDDALRIRLFRAIYGDPVLARYAMNPARPIRIIVVNGQVTLYGTVANKMDRQIAGLRADQVFGSFSVKNDLTTPTTR
jgi:osmotically-inducible protein OsmY